MLENDDKRYLEIKEKINTIHEKIIGSELFCNDQDFDNIDHYNLLCRATAADMSFFLSDLKCNFCMYNCKYEEKDAILIIFLLAINVDRGNKDLSERVITLIHSAELNFTTLDYIKVKKLTDEKWLYLTMIKKSED